MAGAAQGTPQEFWRPPNRPAEQESIALESLPAMAEVCPRCGSEFLLGSKFCHTCGGKRLPAISADARADAAAVAQLWERSIHQLQAAVLELWPGRLRVSSWRKWKAPSWLHYLHFHEIQNWIGLSTGSLIAFVIGLACLSGSLLVGLLNAKTLVEWQAVQMYRIEWLLAATASFVAGILLKKGDRENHDRRERD